MADALTEIQLRWLRDELPDSVTDVYLQGRFDQLGSVRDVAIAHLRDMRSEMLGGPLSVTVQGVASVNYTENVKAIERRINALIQMDDDPSDDPTPPADDATAGYFRESVLTRTRGR